MKTAMKFAALAAVCLSFASATANAGQVIPQPDNCQMRVHVVKIQPQTPRAPVTWDVTVQYKTPNMPGFVSGGKTYNMLEPAVNDFAIRASNRLCFAANDPHRFYDVCPETDLLIQGDLTGFGNFECPLFPGNF
jgi:hypothetical protein